MKKSIYIAFLGCALLMVGCQKQEQPYLSDVVDDPCRDDNLKTGFTIGASIGAPTWNYHNSDYAFTGRNLKFEADKKCFDYYEFQIGANRYYQDCVIVYFNQYDTVKNLPIKLVTKKYDVLCDNYLGSDTAIRYLNTYDICDWPMLGTYRGVTSEFPADSFDVVISSSYLDGTGGQSCYQFNITNFNNSSCFSQLHFYDYSLTKGTFGGAACGGNGGRFVFNPTISELQMHYVVSYAPDYVNSDTITFTGKKI